MRASLFASSAVCPEETAAMFFHSRLFIYALFDKWRNAQRREIFSLGGANISEKCFVYFKNF